MVMRSIALGLDLPEDYFDKKIDRQDHNLRLLSYPPIRTSLLTGDGQARAGAHSGKFVFSHPHPTIEFDSPPSQITGP
jgi:isopenicillin N synthase-like dioxygenase